MVGIITGASSGIGLATAEVLAENGHKVYAVSRTGKPKDPGVKENGNIAHVKGDILDYKAMRELFSSIAEKEGGLDFLVNNAGISVKKRAEEVSEEEFDSVMKTNVYAPYHLSCIAFPYLSKSPSVGRIINIASMSSYFGFELVAPYCVSKGAIASLSRALAVEWANDNITVNNIVPGWFPSELNRKVMDPERQQKILNRMPLHRYGDPRDIGAVINFLLSPSATYITGCDYPVDGGAIAFGY